MNAHTRLLMMGLFAATMTAACGGGSSSPLTVDDFCTQKAAAECGVASLCAIALTDCETARKTACTTSFVPSANIAPRVFVPGNVAACVNNTRSVYAKSLIKPTDLDTVTDVCNYVFQGAVADLAACTTKYDCKNSKDICDKGHCATQTNVPAGGQCANFGAVCPATQYCSTVGAAMMCVAKGAVGATCDATTPCDSTKMLTCTGGMCVAQSASGGACTTDADCLAAAPYCNPYAGNKCSAGLTFSAGAASCSAYGGTASAGTAGASGGTAGAGGGSDGAAGAAGSDASTTDTSTTDTSTTDAGDAATTG